jgi:hypothetical protein
MAKRMPKPDFNVFEVLDITHEKYYSRVLAWLLDPTGNHGQKDFFLKWFMKTCEIPPRTRYERVTLEELIGDARYDSKRAVEQLALYLKVFGPIIKTYVR